MVTPPNDRGVRRGQVYWTDFGSGQGSEQSGRRPAVVVQNDVGNRFSPTTIVAPMTTRVGAKEYPTEVRLPDELFGKPSTVRTAQVRAISQSRLIGPPVASLDSATMARVDEALRLSLGV